MFGGVSVFAKVLLVNFINGKTACYEVDWGPHEWRTDSDYNRFQNMKSVPIPIPPKNNDFLSRFRLFPRVSAGASYKERPKST